MKAVAQIHHSGGELITAEHADAIRSALKSSLYPGASDASIDMVLAYCKASGYDPMKKPVHIVPMKVSTGHKDDRGWDIKETRDVIMPGIGQYRTDAVRTGAYAGCSEPEFGPTKTLTFRREKWCDGANGRRQKQYVDATLEYPEWCKVTITKIVDGKDRFFTAKEYWLENYAEKGDDGAPNAMWEKRPFAQLAKCAEAQALRKAFPDTVGSQPTAEEMEGKSLDIESVPTVRAVVEMPRSKSRQDEAPAQEADFTELPPASKQPEPAKGGTAEPGFHGLSDSQQRIVLARGKMLGLNEAALLQRWPRIDTSNLNDVLKELHAMADREAAEAGQ